MFASNHTRLFTDVQLQWLHDTTRQMMDAESKSELFALVTDAASRVLGFEYNTVRRYDSETEQLVPAAVSPALQAETGQRKTYDRDDSVQWRAIDEGEILVYQTLSDIDDDVSRSGEGCMMVVPLAEYGILTLGSPEPRSIDDHDIQLAWVFAANIETAIARIERTEKLDQRAAELDQRAQQVTVMTRALRHNVRNELNLVMGWLGDLADDLPPAQAHRVEQSLAAAKRIDAMAEKARDIQESIAGDMSMQELDLVTVTEAQLRRAKRSFPSVEFDTTLPEAAGVRAVESVGDAIWEAIENAIVHNEHDTPIVRVRIQQIGETYQLTVADNGPGIPTQEQEVLFDGTEHKLKHGSGFGLWHLKWLLDQSDAELRFADAALGGTAVKMRFLSARTEALRSLEDPC